MRMQTAQILMDLTTVLAMVDMKEMGSIALVINIVFPFCTEVIFYF